MLWPVGFYFRSANERVILAGSKTSFSFFVWLNRHLHIRVRCNRLGCTGLSEPVLIDGQINPHLIVNINTVCPVCCASLSAEIHFPR